MPLSISPPSPLHMWQQKEVTTPTITLMEPTLVMVVILIILFYMRTLHLLHMWYVSLLLCLKACADSCSSAFILVKLGFFLQYTFSLVQSQVNSTRNVFDSVGIFVPTEVNEDLAFIVKNDALFCLS